MAAATGDVLGRNSSPEASPFAAFTVASKPVVETGGCYRLPQGASRDRDYVAVARCARRGTSPVSKDVGQ